MNSTDKTAFAGILVALSEIYGKVLSPPAIELYWNAIKGYPLADVQNAVNRHLNDPTTGQYFPKPADIVRHLQTAQPNDGHPGPDEAWGMLVRLIQDEAETGVLTEEMRKGWEACGQIMAIGDEVGARRCFLEVYSKHLAEARQRGNKPRWTVTLGTDPTLRTTRLQEAIEAGRIGTEHASSLLPGPTTSSISQIAGLLEGPGATPEATQVARGLRGLVDALKAGRGYLENKDDERKHKAEEEAEKKRHIQELLDQQEQQEQRKAS